MARRDLYKRTEKLADRLEAVLAELASWRANPVEAGVGESPRRLVLPALTRLKMVGSRSQVLKLPQRDLHRLCTRILTPGVSIADAVRSLSPAGQKQVSRSAVYRFHRDLHWAVDSLYRGLPAPAAEIEFSDMPERAKADEQRASQHARSRSGQGRSRRRR